MPTRRNSLLALILVVGPLLGGCGRAQDAKSPSTDAADSQDLPKAQMMLAMGVGAMGGQSAIDEIDSYYLEHSVEEPGSSTSETERIWRKNGDFAVKRGPPGNPTLEIWKIGDEFWSRGAASKIHRMEGSELTRAVLTYEFALAARWETYFSNPRTSQRRLIGPSSVIDVELDSLWGERVVMTFEEKTGNLVGVSAGGLSDEAPSYSIRFDGHRDASGLVHATTSVVEVNGKVVAERSVSAFRTNLEIENDKLDPPPGAGIVSASITAVCKKMADLAQSEPDLPAEAKRQMANIDKCAKEGLAEREKDPEKFARGSACIMQAESLEGVMKCALEAEGLHVDR